MFNKHEERPMSHGSCCGWQIGPNQWEKQHHKGHNKGPHHHPHHRHIGPNPPQMWCYMMPMHHERGHHRELKPQMGCPSRKPWEHGMNHHEMNPHDFKEMFHHMHKMKEHPKENFARENSHHHRHGFHW